MEIQQTQQEVAAQERMDYDGWWKDVIEHYWPDFLQWALPDLYEDADLTKKPEFLSKELREALDLPEFLERNAALFVDELVKVFMKDGREEWVLIHIEIQGHGGDNVSFRMTVYGCLIFSHYHKMPVGLALITEPRPSEKLGEYSLRQYGAWMSYGYNYIEIPKLDENILLSSDNPFHLALYAAKKAMLCKKEERQKLIYLREITRLLFSKGFNKDASMGLFRYFGEVSNFVGGGRY